MASKTCTSCLRALSRSSRTIRTHPHPRTPSIRCLSTSKPTSAEPTPITQDTRDPVTPGVPFGVPPTSTTADTAAFSLSSSALRALRNGINEPYAAYAGTDTLYAKCAEQADYSIPQAKDPNADMPKTRDGEDLGVGSGWWIKDLGLNPTFSTWSQVTMLHMYMLTARFRCFPSTISQIWTQQLLDHFFYDAEERMIQNHNMESRGIRNRYLKDLYVQWRGLLAAYDEGLVKGDVVLASAVWRNVFKGREDVDVRGLAAIVGYMRKGLMELDGLADQELMMGRWRVESPKEMCKLVAKRSELMDKEFTEEDEQAMQELVESAEEEEMQKRK